MRPTYEESAVLEKEKQDDVGPLKDKGRSCTDVICLLIYAAFIAGMGILAVYALIWGNPYRIINGYDSWGNICGKDNAGSKNENVSKSGRDMTDLPYLMYFDPFLMIPAGYASEIIDTGSENKEMGLMICVKECPKSTIAMATRMNKYKEYYDNNNQSLCEYDFLEDQIANGETFPIHSSISDDSNNIQNARGPCPSFVFQSDPVMNRCIPLTDLAVAGASAQINETLSLLHDFFGSNSSLDVSQLVEYAISDVSNSYWEIIIMCAASMVISFIIILVLGYLAQIMIYTIGIVCFVACFVAPIYFWYTWYKAKVAYDDLVEQHASDKENVTTLMYYAIIATVVCAIVALIILFLRSRVGLMIALFKEAGKMVITMFPILFTPILLAFCIIAWYALWVFVSAFIYTAGEESVYQLNRTTDPGNLNTMLYQDREYTEYAWLYHLFGLYWGTEFLLAFHEMALAGAFVQLYWTRDRSSVKSPVLRGVWWVVRYHLGTVAFGACIIAIIQMIRTILSYIQKKCKDSNNQFIKYLLMSLQCLMWCFEKVLKFINRNVYIYTAFKGCNFCASAKRVWGLLMDNLVRVAIINRVGSFVLFMGKFLVVIITVMLGYVMMERDESLNYWAIPVFIAGMFSVAVAYCFFSVYEIGIDTIFICFAEDSRINDGSPGREYFMSENLMNWVENSSEAKRNLHKAKKQEKRAKKEADKATKAGKRNEGLYPNLEDTISEEM